MTTLEANRVSYLTIACTARDRYFDLDAVRTPIQHPNATHTLGRVAPNRGDAGDPEGKALFDNPAGAPPLDWFQLPADELSLLLCKAMVPRRVCRECGEPSRRIVGEPTYVQTRTGDAPAVMDYRDGHDAKDERHAHLGGTGRLSPNTNGLGDNGVTRVTETLGWTDCGHNNWRPGVAYDPFLRNEDGMPARFIVGDALTELRKMPDSSVDLVMTSPPFLALRSYLPADHPDKAKEIDSESTPGEYLDVLLDVVEECRRVLAPHGTLVVELGDTYAGSGGAGGDYAEAGVRDGQEKFDGSARRGRSRVADDGRPTSKAVPNRGSGNGIPSASQKTVAMKGRGWPLDKSLTGIPELFMLSLTYGRNLLTGRELEPWRVRNFCPWVRPNPPVGALGDKFRPATSYLTVACVSRDRWFDLDAVRTPHTEPGADRQHGSRKSPTGGDWLPRKREDVEPGSSYRQADLGTGSVGDTPGSSRSRDWQQRNPSRYGSDKNPSHGWGSQNSGAQNPAGAPPLDWFNIPTAPYKGAHYATYPPDLVVPFIKAMCPSRVCRVCGKPSSRIVGEPEYVPDPTHRTADTAMRGGNRTAPKANAWSSGANNGVVRQTETLGWTDCGCACPECMALWKLNQRYKCEHKWRPGVVLDPFAGSGTTLQVATGHGRDAIGIDLDPRNADLAVERCGMFLTVEDHEEYQPTTETDPPKNPRYRDNPSWPGRENRKSPDQTRRP